MKYAVYMAALGLCLLPGAVSAQTLLKTPECAAYKTVSKAPARCKTRPTLVIPNVFTPPKLLPPPDAPKVETPPATSYTVTRGGNGSLTIQDSNGQTSIGQTAGGATTIQNPGGPVSVTQSGNGVTITNSAGAVVGRGVVDPSGSSVINNADGSVTRCITAGAVSRCN